FLLIHKSIAMPTVGLIVSAPLIVQLKAVKSYLYIAQRFPFSRSVSSCLRMGQGCIPSTSQVRVYLFLPVSFKVQLS
ncbi:MAG: hypothetical protein WCJ02_14735, partial [bacterium]